MRFFESREVLSLPDDVLRDGSSRAMLCSSNTGLSGGLADGLGLNLVQVYRF